MAIGTPYTVSTAPARGIRIFSGFNGSIIDSIFRDDGMSNQFGAASSSIGDVNGDGRSEFACSNPYFGDMGFTTFPPPPPAPGLIQVYQARGPVVQRVQSEGHCHLVDLSWFPVGGNPNGVVGSWVASGAFPGSAGIVGATLSGAEVNLFGCLPVLLDLAPQFALVSANFGFDIAGSSTFANVSRQNAALAGMRFHVQVFSTSPIVGRSNALVMRITP